MKNCIFYFVSFWIYDASHFRCRRSWCYLINFSCCIFNSSLNKYGVKELVNYEMWIFFLTSWLPSSFYRSRAYIHHLLEFVEKPNITDSTCYTPTKYWPQPNDKGSVCQTICWKCKNKYCTRCDRHESFNFNFHSSCEIRQYVSWGNKRIEGNLQRITENTEPKFRTNLTGNYSTSDGFRWLRFENVFNLPGGHCIKNSTSMHSHSANVKCKRTDFVYCLPSAYDYYLQKFTVMNKYMVMTWWIIHCEWYIIIQ